MARKVLFLILVLLIIFPMDVIATASNLVFIQINNSKNITFLNHTSDKNGNWIELEGNKEMITIPRITFHYEGISFLSLKKNGKTVNITSPSNYKVTYPFKKHPMYANNSLVNASFKNSSDISGNIDIFLTKTYPTELIDITSKILDGNTKPFENLLSKSRKWTKALSNETRIEFGRLDAGDYAAIILLNESNKNNFTIVSATTFQVMEYELIASVPTNVQKGDVLNVPVRLESAPNANYTYAAFLIHEDFLNDMQLYLSSNGTKGGTNFTANDAHLVEGFKIAGVGLNKLSKSKILGIVNGTAGNTIAGAFTGTAGNSISLSFDTDDLDRDKYELLIGVWSNIPGKRLVGFIQEEIIIKKESKDNNKGGSGGGSGGGGVITSEPYENIKMYETRDGDLLRGRPVKYYFNSKGISIYEIEVIGKENENGISFRVEYLNSFSRLVKEQAHGKVNHNVNIWSGSRNIHDATIRFRVENSWITSNDLNGNDIRMLKWDGNKWKQLETIEMTKDNEYTYYEAKSDSFSHFAITGLKEEANAAQAVSDVNETGSLQITPALIKSVNQPVSLVLIIVTLFVIIALVSFFMIKKRIK